MPTHRKDTRMRNDGAQSLDDWAPSPYGEPRGTTTPRQPRVQLAATHGDGQGHANRETPKKRGIPGFGKRTGASRKKENAPVTSLLHDYVMLAVKVGFLLSVVGVMMTFVFGAYRETTEYMAPSVRNGDLIVYYRLTDRYAVGSVIVFDYEGEIISGRIIAAAGDTVNITPQGLIINGSAQHEENIYVETTQVADGVTFPLVVPEGSVFVLGDNRPIAVDSRIVGCVPIDRIRGEMIGLFRRRNF